MINDKTGPNGNRIAALRRRAEDLATHAPELTEKQIAELARVLAPLVAAVERAA